MAGEQVIDTVVQLLQSIRAVEEKKIEEFGVKHAPTIGLQYEALTRILLEEAVFQGFDLRVVSGFIVNDDDKSKESNQIDCMIVVGDGEEVPPRTGLYRYRISQVVAVIEVKKSLYSKDITEAYDNLFSVYAVSGFYPPKYEMFESAYRSMYFRRLPSQDQANELNIEEQMHYNFALSEAILPARIVIGYRGFASEFSLREKFFKYLEGKQASVKERRKLKPTAFPNLVISGGYSLVKLNGIPYSAKLDNSNVIPFYASYAGNPYIPLLEVIWTRLSHMFNISPVIFGEDLETEVLNPLLFRKVESSDKGQAWRFIPIRLTRQELGERPLTTKWEPVQVSSEELDFFATLCAIGYADLQDSEFLGYINSITDHVDAFLGRLQFEGLISIEDGTIYPLTIEAATLCSPDGNFYIAENRSGRMARYVLDKYQPRRLMVIKSSLSET